MEFLRVCFVGTHAVLYIAGVADLFHFGHNPDQTTEARPDPDLT
jgi:hypothetical protein